MAKTENNNVDVENANANDGKVGMNDIIVETEDSLPKKILKWALGGLACAATGVVGFFLGRASVKDNDNDEEPDNVESDD